MTPSEVLRELSDRAAIHDVVMRYFFAVDDRDWAAVRACFTADARLDYVVFSGGADEVVDTIARGLAHFTRIMHHGGNVLIELAGDEARCETYAVCHHRFGEGNGARDRVSAIRYRDRLRRQGGGWRIAERAVTFVWERLEPVTPAPPPRNPG
jgi:3-phenylpropionate/cinnamic acid dioxygenase small subunit